MWDTEILLSVKMMVWVTIHSIFHVILIFFLITKLQSGSFFICDSEILMQLFWETYITISKLSFFILLDDERHYNVLLIMLSLTYRKNHA